jgi:hypothetical protein
LQFRTRLPSFLHPHAEKGTCLRFGSLQRTRRRQKPAFRHLLSEAGNSLCFFAETTVKLTNELMNQLDDEFDSVQKKNDPVRDSLSFAFVRGWGGREVLCLAKTARLYARFEACFFCTPALLSRRPYDSTAHLLTSGSSSDTTVRMLAPLPTKLAA